MTGVSTLTPWMNVVRLRQFFWRRPEWWTLVLCGFGWWAMLLHFQQHAAHGVHHRMSISGELQTWMLMVFAMMLPLVQDAVRTVAFASLWARRHRAMVAFIAAYSVPWLAFGLAVALLRREAWAHTYAAPAIVFLIAAIWQLTPMHATALISCHRTMPLAPTGWRADRDCLQLGCRIGLACTFSCWPLMLGCACAGHGIAAMTGGMALGLAERRSFQRRTGFVLVGTLLLASYYAALAIAEQ